MPESPLKVLRYHGQGMPRVPETHPSGQISRPIFGAKVEQMFFIRHVKT